jgi:hypothetical protein
MISTSLQQTHSYGAVGGIQIGRRYLATKEAIEKHALELTKQQRRKRQGIDKAVIAIANELGLKLE